MTQTIRFKKLRPDAVTPTKANPGDAGWDLTAISTYEVAPSGTPAVEYRTGIAVEIPDGYVGLICPRSSVSSRGMWLANSVGVIDSGYRGEVMLRFYYRDWTKVFVRGERVGQLVIVPIWSGELVEADELSETERGSGGFGSSGV